MANVSSASIARHTLALLSSIFVFAHPALQGQSVKDSIVRVLERSANYASTDALLNCYLITTDNRLEKYDSSGRLVAYYLNNRLGKPSTIDASNPMKLALWYADFQVVAFLDRTLSEMGLLRLNAVGFQQITAVATASDGNLWAYDAAAFKLYKLGPQGERLFESQAMTQFELVPQQATMLSEINGSVWLLDELGMVWVFDLFGQLQRSWRLAHHPKSFVIRNEELYYTSKTYGVAESLDRLGVREFAYPLEGIWSVTPEYLVLFDRDCVRFFSFFFP